MPRIDAPRDLPRRPHSGSPLQAVADAAARHYKEQFGRGPVRCTAHFAGRDALIVVLDGTMSAAEVRLVSEGNVQQVRGYRTLLQHGVQPDLRATVEGLVGRRVIHALSGIDVGTDVVSEYFAFEPDEVSPAG